MSFEINVKVNGKRIRQYRHDGKIYVEGREGSNFSLEMKNNSRHRVLAILSVDGLSVMDGKRADWNSSSGYVVDGHSSIVIPGWRLNDESVAQFTFSGRGDSYAASKGSAAKKNIGTIGCAVFREKPLSPTGRFIPLRRVVTDLGDTTPMDVDITFTTNDGFDNVTYDAGSTTRRETATSGTFLAGASGETISSSTVLLGRKKKAAGQLGTLNLGTEFGESTSHAVRAVSFIKEDSPAAVMEIIYSDRTGLEKMGVDLKRPTHRRYTEPSAFANQGCEPPAGWNG
jgi:hypothetical protein